jgi:hypothetical protein
MIRALIPPADDGRGVGARRAPIGGTRQLDRVAERRAVWNHQRAQLARERNAKSDQGFESIWSTGRGDSREIRRLDQRGVARACHGDGYRIGRWENRRKRRSRDRTR